MLQHYLPATYLASFSAQVDLPSRERHIAVGEKGTGRTFWVRVSGAAAVNNLYSLLNHPDPLMIEKLWQDYEIELAGAFSALLDGSIEAGTWARVLVPFIASLFVRSPDFNDRFEARLAGLDVPLPEDNTNLARLHELQRMLGPVTGAEWILYEAVGSGPILTNDVGFAPFMDAHTREKGVAIPMDSRHIIGLLPKRHWPVVSARAGSWFPNVQRRILKRGGHLQFNAAVVSAARRWVFGADECTLNRFLSAQPARTQLPDLIELGFLTAREQLAHEFTWHRLVSALGGSPDDHSAQLFQIDMEVLATGWHPPVMVPTNFPECAPALLRRGDSIWVNFYDPECYYLESAAIRSSMMQDHAAVITECSAALELAFDARQTARLLKMRATALEKAGRCLEAIADLDKAAELSPVDAEVYVHRCILEVEVGRLVEAIGDCSHAIEICPRHGGAYSNRGLAHLRCGQPSRAVADFDLAVSLLTDGPAKGRALMNRGSTLKLMGRPQQAIRDFTASLEQLAPEDRERASCHLGLAECYRSTGQIGPALAEVNAALEWDPSDRFVLALRADIVASMHGSK